MCACRKGPEWYPASLAPCLPGEDPSARDAEEEGWLHGQSQNPLTLGGRADTSARGGVVFSSVYLQVISSPLQPLPLHWQETVHFPSAEPQCLFV